eukprot:TRINITY_DN31730_c0_g1_i1.p1 TRINITY_DN31730_c0_g1~~TRINITY_DN31730_c0_g1_i1.p1  ORF type:complete len:667 (-),score=110.98 TRINITY_DN31730_c0_g1_i1:219-2171(-)
MSSWLTSGAEGLRSSFLNAATSVQRLAEQPPDFQQLGERVRNSVHSIGELGEEALQASRDSAVVKDLGLDTWLSAASSSATEAPSAEEIYAREAQALDECARETPESIATVASKTFSRWRRRLGHAVSSEDESHRSRSMACMLLLRSNAIHVALAALARASVGRSICREAANAKDNYYSEGLRGSLDKKAGAALFGVLAYASAAPTKLTRRLLLLLADVADASATNGASLDTAGRPDNVRWVLALISATLVDVDEAAMARAGSGDGVGEALAAVESATIAAERRKASVKDDESFEVGEEVWAEWPTSGHWYKARIVEMSTEGRLRVHWLHPPEDVECGMEEQYLGAATGETTTDTDLPAGAVVKRRQARPGLAISANRSDWKGQLDAAEALSQSFRELRVACEHGGEHSKLKLENVEGSAVVSKLTSLQKSIVAMRETSLPISPSSQVEALRDRIDRITKERAELIAKLQMLDEELIAIRTQAAKSGNTERLLSAEVSELSEEVEASIADRCQTAAATAGKRQVGTKTDLGTACLRAEQLRQRQLEELVAGMHALAWGSSSEALGHDSVGEVSGQIARASAIAEQAWKETVQLAAATLDEGGVLGAPGCSEQLSRSATRYKELRKQLDACAARVSKLETFAPPARATEKS